MTFEEWFEKTGPGWGYVWEPYLDEIILDGRIVDHEDIKMYMEIAYLAGQKSVKGKK